MSLNTVTLTWKLTDLIQSGESATLAIEPTAELVDATDGEIVAEVPRPVTFTGGTGRLPGIVANDNPNIQPQGQGYTITVTTASGQVIYSETVVIAYANGAVQDLSALSPASATPLSTYLQLPTGTPTAGDVPAATGAGTATTWAAVLANPMNAAGDLIQGGTGGAAQRLAIGSTAQVLSVLAGMPAWQGLAALGALLAANDLSEIAAAGGAAQAAARGNLGLGSAATQSSSAFDAAGAASAVLAAIDALIGAANGIAGLGSGGTVPTAQLPAATTSAQGAVILDGTASDIQPVGAAAAAGNSTKAAAGNHVHAGMSILAATSVSGYTLVNGTGTLASWTAPSDGNLHYVQVIADLNVTSTETGGAIGWSYANPAAGVQSPTLIAAAQAAGAHHSEDGAIVEAGTTVTVSQSGALTGGAATAWAVLLGM